VPGKLVKSQSAEKVKVTMIRQKGMHRL